MIETWVEMMGRHKSERKAAFSDLAERGMTVDKAAKVLGMSYVQGRSMAINLGVEFVRNNNVARRRNTLTMRQIEDLKILRAARVPAAQAYRSIGRSDLIRTC